jgi:DNA polymerase III subunit beta
LGFGINGACGFILACLLNYLIGVKVLCAMKLSLERTHLQRALAHIQSVVERRATIPILSNVLLRAEAGRLSLTGTDMELEVVEEIAALVHSPGTISVPALTLYDIVRKLPDGSQITLTLEGGQLGLVAGRGRYHLPTLPADEFPLLVAGDTPTTLSLKTGDVAGLIDRTRFAISTEETRYYLNGIYLHVKPEAGGLMWLRAVATDGHRLALAQLPLPSDVSADMPGVILPRKAVGELRKLLDDAPGGEVRVEIGQARIRFSLPGMVLTSKLIDGTFPDYERVIPNNNDKCLSLEARALLAAVDRVATISSEKSRSIKLNINDHHLVLSASSVEAGSASEDLEVAYKAPQLEVGFNSRYLMDVAQQLGSHQVELWFADAASPCLIRAPNDPSILFVLMPMRV